MLPPKKRILALNDLTYILQAVDTGTRTGNKIVQTQINTHMHAQKEVK